jgi:hypothetical protein
MVSAVVLAVLALTAIGSLRCSADDLDENDSNLQQAQILRMPRRWFYAYYDAKIGGHRSEWRAAAIYAHCQDSVIEKRISYLRSQDHLLMTMVDAELKRWQGLLMSLLSWHYGGSALAGMNVYADAERTNTMYHLTTEFRQLRQTDRKARRIANRVCSRVARFASHLKSVKGPEWRRVAWDRMARLLAISGRRLVMTIRRAPDRVAARIAHHVEHLLNLDQW